jgi:hypothetical protein
MERRMIVEEDGWSFDIDSMSSADNLEKIRAVLEREPLIVEHRFYRGSSAPDRLVFDDYQVFLTYLNTRARPGDHFLTWGYLGLCRDDNTLVNGKYPDRHGRTPQRGAY